MLNVQKENMGLLRQLGPHIMHDMTYFVTTAYIIFRIKISIKYSITDGRGERITTLNLCMQAGHNGSEGKQDVCVLCNWFSSEAQ